MSNVKNDPKYKNGLLQAIRAQLEHRAFWLYLLCDEAKKRGLDPRDFGSDAVKRCGLSQGADLVKKGGTDSLKGLRKTLFTKPAQLVFEMKILESTDDKLSIDFHYCPLVKAWQKAGCSDEEIAMLCDIAMCGDHGIGECYGSVLDLPKCIAKGDDICSLRYHKKDVAEEQKEQAREAIAEKAMERFSYRKINYWLRSIGMIEWRDWENGKQKRFPTADGEAALLVLKIWENYGRRSPVIYFSSEAQQFVIDNIEAVIAAERGSLESYRDETED